MASMVLPRVQAMVLCDGVEESEYEAAVYDLAGVRTVIESPFPAVVPRLCVFLHMSGHKGSSSISVAIEKAAPNEVVFETETQTVVFQEPLPLSQFCFFCLIAFSVSGSILRAGFERGQGHRRAIVPNANGGLSRGKRQTKAEIAIASLRMRFRASPPPAPSHAGVCGAPAIRSRQRRGCGG
jgi:hypothetical protein